MIRLLVITLTTLALALAGVACDSGTTGGSGDNANLEQTCSPNLQQECPCGGGVTGIQACAEDGMGWTPCQCGEDSPEADLPLTVDGNTGSTEPVPAGPMIDGPCDDNGEELCAGDEEAVLICSGGTWRESFACSEGELCEDADCVADPAVCAPSCSGMACGDDGCGGSCGSCPPGETCNNISGVCEGGDGNCVPNASKECVEADGVVAAYWYNSCGEQGAWIETCQGDDYCSGGECVQGCTYHAAKRCSGDTIMWYDSCGEEESAFQACESYEYCIHTSDTEAACLKGVYAGQWMVEASPSDPMFYDNVFTLTEDSEAGTVTFQENIPGVGMTYYTGTLDGKLLIAEGSYDSGGATYAITIQITFSVPPDTNGVAPTAFTGFWATDAQLEGMSLGSFVTNIVGTKQ
ncbi:MAG: hypothetical protein ACPGU1_16895 [Myxococcota bacterium]